MKTHNVQQGSAEWLELRKGYFSASDAAAMMGVSPYKTRTELLKEKHTGLTPEIDPATQRRFDDGHRFEELARPLAEKEIGEELYPCVGTNDKYLASFDGLTMLEDTAWEHKTLNEALRSVMVEGATGADLPEHYRIQMEQQLMVSGADKVLFSATKWDGNGELIEDRHCWYVSDPDLRSRIIAGWAQFEKDLAEFEDKPEVAQVVGRTPENLPALRIEVSGQVTASNLVEYRDHAVAVFKSINRDLVTDQDFADAEKTIKWCKDVEDRLVAAKDHALSQTASIDQLFKAIDDISSEARATRLELNRLVTAEKENLRNKIRIDAESEFAEHIKEINRRLVSVRLPVVKCDVTGAMKGKRTLATLQDAADTEVARAKAEANELAADIGAKLDWFADNVETDYQGLFRDLDDLVTMPEKQFSLVIVARVEQHQKAEADRLERERERIEAEIKAKAEREELIIQAQKFEPEPETVLKQPVKPVAKIKPASTRPNMPTASEIIGVLAAHFSVSESDVVIWLKEIDLTEASREALAF